MTTHFDRLPDDVQKELSCIAKQMVAAGKGILAADEPPATMGDRFQGTGVENTEENRRQWRQVLYSTDAEVAKYISGVILSDEALRQCSDAGCLFVDVLKKNGILSGICVDQGLVKMFNSEEETTTQGLDDLAARCEEYKSKGCSFAKWRAAYKIGEKIPSYQSIIENANALGRYAAICQAKRMVPIVEPDISIEGDYDLDRGQKVAETILAFTYKALNDHHIFLEGTVLKASMVTAGNKCTKKYTSEDFAKASVLAMFRNVPPAVPGVAFLSGGQTDEQATEVLNAINNVSKCKPWMLTFCFGRALQGAALRAWGGRKENTAAAQKIFLERAKANALASQGKYDKNSSGGGCSPPPQENKNSNPCCPPPKQEQNSNPCCPPPKPEQNSNPCCPPPKKEQSSNPCCPPPKQDQNSNPCCPPPKQDQNSSPCSQSPQQQQGGFKPCTCKKK